jgi:hypothetical protein
MAEAGQRKGVDSTDRNILALRTFPGAARLPNPRQPLRRCSRGAGRLDTATLKQAKARVDGVVLLGKNGEAAWRRLE